MAFYPEEKELLADALAIVLQRVGWQGEEACIFANSELRHALNDVGPGTMGLVVNAAVGVVGAYYLPYENPNNGGYIRSLEELITIGTVDDHCSPEDASLIAACEHNLVLGNIGTNNC